MGFEVDFHPVEAGEKSGDAISFKVWRDGTYWVCAVDGGYTDDGDALVDHINTHYGTNRVNLAVLTHPDADHASGLLRVVEQMTVDRLWMHRPWNYGNLAPLFKNDRVTDASVRDALRRDLDIAKAVEKAALKKGVVIEEPFANTSYEDLAYVIGPTRQFYTEQIAHFSCTPAPVSPVRKPLTLASLLGAPPKQEDWLNETLDDECDTSAENNTSVILAVKLGDDYWAMFTGDAGEPAILGALDWLDYTNFSTSNFKFVQIPHHGSEHNISPTVLDRWLGSPQLFDRKTRTAYVSSALKAPKHPSQKVMNAFRRRGAWPYATEGVGLCHSSGDAPPRFGWNTLNSPYPFHHGAA